MEQEGASVQHPWWHRLRWRATSRAEASDAEQALITLSRTNLSVTDVRVGPGPHDYMHTITGGSPDATPLVYIPGYGAGAGFLFRAFEGLTAGFRMFGVDLLGTGLSGRPKFRAKSTQEAESFFIDSLERWREASGLQEVVLVGHSLGGYLSAVYALKYPERVRHLVLVCPAGVGARPADWSPPEGVRNPWTVRGQLYRAAVAVWNTGVTPGSIIRGLGPWGESIVEGYTRRRFRQGHRLEEEEILAFQRYMYQILAARGSGEFALRHLLEPFAFPRSPLEDRLHKLKVPLTFIYGEHDWMDPKAAERVIEKIQEAQPERGALVAGAADLRVLYTPNAGHYPFIDQPGVFLNQIIETCDGYLSDEAKMKIKKVAARHPFVATPVAGDTKEELAEEMRRNPAEAEAHVATDL